MESPACVTTTAEVAAYFIRRAGGQWSLPSLARLLYVTERGHWMRHRAPLVGDAFWVTADGPCLASTRQWLEVGDDRTVAIDQPLDRARLTRVSDAALDWLATVHRFYGGLTAAELTARVATECTTWRSLPAPGPMPLATVLRGTDLGPAAPEEALATADRWLAGLGTTVAA